MNHILDLQNFRDCNRNFDIRFYQRDDKILVGKPTLPSFEELIPHLKNIWNSKIVSNNGPYLKEFEKKLEEYLEVKSVVTFSNATTALISLLHCLNLKGQILTTPFTFVATANVIHLSGLKPKFIDINKDNYNIDPIYLKKNSLKSVDAIMPVHIFSKPAFIDEFQLIGKKEKVKIIYDGSHAFGAKYKNKSLLSYGKASVVSFHATKLLSTLEGGAVVTNDLILAKKLKLFRNFGFDKTGQASLIGLNGKLNEIQALIGLLQLENIDRILLKRKQLADYYREKINQISYLFLPKQIKNHIDNNSYFPVEITSVSKIKRNKLLKILEDNKIFCKMYFYPIITKQPAYKKAFYKQKFLNAESLSKKILCFPIYPEMTFSDVDYIFRILKSVEN